jgi:L-iditol 2-dehydrogenase
MAVIGAGPIGLLFIHAAALAGVEVIAVVKRDEQVLSAKSLGAAHVVQITTVDDPVASVRALTPDERGVDIAIEAVALPQTWHWAVDMVRRGGVVNFFGGPAAGTRVDFDTNQLHYNDITLKASFHHTPAACRRAFELITSGSFHSGDFITGRAPLRELSDVFHRLMDRSNDIKTVIVP